MKQIFIFLFLFLTHCHYWQDNQFETKDFYSPHLDSNSHIVFDDALPLPYSSQYYRIQASLYENNSSFVLHSHFKNFNQKGGIEVEVLRENTALKIFIRTPQYSKKLLFENNSYFATTKDIFFTFKISNEWDNLFVSVWNNWLNQSGLAKRPYYSLETRNLIADSKENNVILHSYGKGLNWGIKLNKTHLISATRTATK